MRIAMNQQELVNTRYTYPPTDITVLSLPEGFDNMATQHCDTTQAATSERWVIGLQHAGEFTFKCDNRYCEVGPGDLFLLSPNIRVEKIEYKLEQVAATIVSFPLYPIMNSQIPNAFFDQFATTIALKGWVASTNTSQFKRLSELLSILKQFSSPETKGGFFAEEKRSSALSLLLFEIGEVFIEAKHEQIMTSHNKSMLFHKFHLLAKQHFSRHHKLDFYANELCISAKYLSELTKETTGITGGRFIDSLLEQEAKHLLRYTNLTISEISYQLHYGDQSAFGKAFKRFTGVSPKHYRELKG